ncbi:MAG: Ig-like domain-containing protein [Lachnospiraceae bacterium]|nr:Ig-like domain-containing protein [Lachnospiraceae bacterium]
MADYLSIEGMTQGLEGKVKQDLKFKTGNFVWKVKFNVPLDPKTVNNVNLYVTTEGLSPLKTAIRYNSLENMIEIEPLEPYAQDETYILNLTTNVTSLGGKALKEAQQLRFKI